MIYYISVEIEQQKWTMATTLFGKSNTPADQKGKTNLVTNEKCSSIPSFHRLTKSQYCMYAMRKLKRGKCFFEPLTPGLVCARNLAS